MDVALLLIVIIWLIVNQHQLKELRAEKQHPPQYELTPVKAHRLVRTWVEPEPGDGGWPGWRFLCTCGTSGMATNTSKGTLGSEQNAVKQFTTHASLFASVDEDDWKTRYEAKVAEFEAYRKLCYCKDTNDDLIKYRGK